jgi:hypothetical protein
MSATRLALLAQTAARRSYAAAAAAKKKAPSTAKKGAAGPRKQVLMARKKASTVAQPEPSAAGIKAALVDALFTQKNDGSDAGPAAQRTAVYKAWTRTCMLALHARTARERAFVASRDEAVTALRRVAPLHAAMAEHPLFPAPDPPVHRRLPTLTPPDIARLPLACAQDKL